MGGRGRGKRGEATLRGDAFPSGLGNDRVDEGTPLPCSCGGGSFRSGVQPPTGIRDIFISLTRNENSAMTVLRSAFSGSLRGWIVPVGDAIPDRRGGFIILRGRRRLCGGGCG